MQKKLLLLSFIEGAAVMAAELCGAKLLAPIFGSSLYVWASVMGITLAALALGYFFGGWLSEKSKNNKKTLFQILICASLFLLLMPVISFYLVQRISYLPFLSGVVLGTISLLFFPVLFLGASSPLFISIQSNQRNSAGKVSGIVYAISTLGGIFSTFLCGFYLIPQIGLSACLILFGGALFAVNVLIFKFFNRLNFFLFISFSYLNFQFYSKENNYIFSSESILGQLIVQDCVYENKDTVRLLRVNNIFQTEMNLKTKHSVSSYVDLLDTLIPRAVGSKNALVLGLGGGLTANLLEEKKYQTDAVEIDERIIEVAKNFFFLNKNVNAIEEDARYFLNKMKKKYDIILVDVFKAEEQPSHILTSESLVKLRNNLSDSALLLINWHGYTNANLGLGTSILNNTLLKAGFTVQLCSKIKDENTRNIIFVASSKALANMPFRLNEKLAMTNLLNTDNLPLLEKYNAEANKIWRTNYLRFYQRSNNYQ